MASARVFVHGTLGLRRSVQKDACPGPTPPEQAAIVRFLDHADRRIRRYIRAKQKLIKLLEEQKQAIIHRAVTRGLDPNVRLKPSGVAWLGDMPGHWQVELSAKSRFVPHWAITEAYHRVRLRGGRHAARQPNAYDHGRGGPTTQHPANTSQKQSQRSCGVLPKIDDLSDDRGTTWAVRSCRDREDVALARTAVFASD